jgi:hypothetical protein
MNDPFQLRFAYESTRDDDLELIAKTNDSNCSETFSSFLSWIPIEMVNLTEELLLIDYVPDDRPLTYTAPDFDLEDDIPFSFEELIQRYL